MMNHNHPNNSMLFEDTISALTDTSTGSHNTLTTKGSSTPTVPSAVTTGTGGGHHRQNGSGRSLLQEQRKHFSLRLSNNVEDELKTSISQISIPAEARRRRNSYHMLQDELTINKLRFHKVGFYGREKEVQTLRECFDRVVSSANSTIKTTNHEICFIKGFSGSGKTTLVEKSIQSFMEPFDEDDVAIFVQGKYDLNLQDALDPNVGLLYVCRCLCQGLQRQLLRQQNVVQEPEDDAVTTATTTAKTASSRSRCRSSKKTVKTIQEQFHDQLGTELNLLTDIIPELHEIMMMEASTTSSNNDDNDDGGNEDTGTNNEDSQSKNKVFVTKNKNDDTNSVSTQARNQQFQYLLRVLIRIVSSCFKPLVMLFDDLQWASKESLDLISSIMTDCENTSSLIIIGCYRSNEVDELHPLSRMITNLSDKQQQEKKHCITTMEVNNLTVEDCNLILMDLLSIDIPDVTMELAELCYQRTLGNVYFFIQFITMLYEQSFLEFHLGLLQWTWNISKITQETVASVNVVTVVRQRMENQSSHTVKHFLKVLSCLGPQPSMKVIQLAWNKVWTPAAAVPEITSQSSSDLTRANDDIASIIQQAIEAHYIERMDEHRESLNKKDDTRLRFVHDKILEASISLMTNEERIELRYTIGKHLFRTLQKEEVDSELFLIAELLDTDIVDTDKDTTNTAATTNETTTTTTTSVPNNGIATTTVSDDTTNNHANIGPNEEDRQLIIGINLRAAEKAKSLSAFTSSVKFAMKGISLLKEDECWQSPNYDTTLRLYSVGAETASSIGQVDTLEEISTTVLSSQGSIPILDALRVYNALLDSMASNGKLVDAQHLVCKLLDELGCKVPKFGLSLAYHTMKPILKLRRKAPTKEMIERLPKMIDRTKSECLRLLYQLQTFSYLNREVPLFLWSCTKQILLTMKYGLHELSAAAFPAMGAIMVALFTDFQTGTLFARNGKFIVELVGSRTAEARVAFSSIMAPSYYQPMQSLIKGLSESYKVGMQVGDTDSAMWCIAHSCWLQFMTGKKLPYVEDECRVSVNRMKDLNRQEAVHFTSPIWQTTLNLIGSSSQFTTVMAGDAFGVNNEQDIWDITKDGPLRPHLEICKTALLTYFGEYREGADLFIQRGDRYLKDHPGHPQGNMDSFLKGVCLFAAAQETGKRHYRTHAYKARATIASWWKKGNPNSQHQLSFLDAEHYAIHKKWENAAVCYQKAITLASRSGLIQDAAFANERYSICLVQQGNVEEAKFRLLQSIKLFQEWGAMAVVKSLKQRHEKILTTISDEEEVEVSIGVL